jgi:UDP-glucose 4-epimerase
MIFVFTEDIACASLLAAASNAIDEVCDIGSGIETSLPELAEALERALDSAQPAEFGPLGGLNAVNRRLADILFSMLLANSTPAMSIP